MTLKRIARITTRKIESDSPSECEFELQSADIITGSERVTYNRRTKKYIHHVRILNYRSEDKP